MAVFYLAKIGRNGKIRTMDKEQEQNQTITTPTSPSLPRPEKKSRKWIIWLIVGVFIISLGGLGLYI